LREHKVELDEINYAKTGLDEATIKMIVAKAGGVAAVLNARHATAKANDWVNKPPSASAFAKAAAEDPNLMKRPILIAGDRVIIGFDPKAYAKL
jgi:arsenate reductase-like glutaredoxin family protein